MANSNEVMTKNNSNPLLVGLQKMLLFMCMAYHSHVKFSSVVVLLCSNKHFINFSDIPQKNVHSRAFFRWF